MVQKKCKHGFNTGNTLRRAALQDVNHKTQATVWVKYLEYAQSEIQGRLESLLSGSSSSTDQDDQMNYLWALQDMLDTLTYLPTSGVEFSLDKDRRWEVMNALETHHLNALWCEMPEKDGPEVLPFEITHQNTENRKMLERSFCYYGETDQSRAGPHGEKLPYDPSLRRQAIYHNQGRRGIQRKAHLQREKKVFTKRSEYWTHHSYYRGGWIKTVNKPRAYQAEDNYRQSREASFVDSNPPSVFVTVTHSDKLTSKRCALFKARDALDEFRKPERKESVGTFYGSPHGASSGLRGVHVVSQARFHALKSLEERRLHPPADPSWIYRAPVTRQPVSEWTEPEPAPGKQRRRNSYSKKQFKKQRFKEIEEVKRSKGSHMTSQEKSNKAKTDGNIGNQGNLGNQGDVVEPGGSRDDKPKKPSKQERRLERKLAKKELRNMYRDAKYDGLYPPSKRLQNSSRVQEPTVHHDKQSQELDKIIEYSGNIPESSETSAFTGLNPDKVTLDFDIGAGSVSSKGFFATEPSFDLSSKDTANKIKKRSKDKIKPKVKVKGDVKVSSEVTSEDGKDIGRQRVDVPLWHVIRSIIEPEKHRGANEIQITECGDGCCSLVTDHSNHVNQLVPARPHGNRTTKLRTRIKEPPEVEIIAKESGSGDEPPQTKNIKKKKRRKRKGKPELSGLLQKKAASVEEHFVPIGFLARVKTSTLQTNYLRQKYGAKYREGLMEPRRFWVDVSDLVADVRNNDRMNTGVMSDISEGLPFMNIHAVLLIEQWNVKLPRSSSESVEVTEKSTPHQRVAVQLKCDLDLAGKKELYTRVRAKVRPHMLYPLPKLIEYFVEVYKVLILEGFSYTEQRLSMQSDSPTLRIRQYEWLYTLTSWEYHVYSGLDTYHMFKNKLLELSQATSPRVITTHNASHQNHHKSQPAQDASLRPHEAAAGSQNAVLRLPDGRDLCSYTSCESCSKTIITSADFSGEINSRELISQLSSITEDGWTMSYGRSSGCGHIVCDMCLHLHVLQEVRDTHASTVTCPMTGCSMTIDPVLAMSAVSLTNYCNLLRQKVDRVVSSHPQWEWCPAIKCDRAVKIGGTALLEATLVIECFCRHAWCFQCKKAAHWPAACDETAMYMELRETASCHGYKMGKLLCGMCEDKTNESSRKPRPPADNAGKSLEICRPGQKSGSLSSTSGCDCVFVFCPRCLNVPECPFNVPKTILDNKTVSMMSSQDALLPVLLFRQAVCHHRLQDQWRPEVTEPKAALLARFILKSKASVSTQAPSLGRAKTSLHVVPSTGTDKLFLVLVYQFVYQAHMFLEFVYIELMTHEIVSTTTRTEIFRQVMKLEQNISDIDKIVNGYRYSPAVIMSRLKHLSDAGKALMSALATRLRHMSPTSSPRPSPRLQGHRTLPPLQNRNPTI